MATKKVTQAAKIRNYKTKHPMATITEVAKAIGVRYQAVYAALKPNVKTPKQKWGVVHMSTSNEQAMPFQKEAEQIYELTKGRQRIHPVTGKMLMENVERITMEEPKADNVNEPAHYKVGGIETIDFIEAKGLNYHLGNVVKYITRADTKGNREEDLLKARWYLNREIAKFSK